MKKIAILFAAAALFLAAAPANAQLQVGAGYLNSTLNTTIRDNKANSNSNGVYAGLSYNIPIVAGLGIAPGVYYSLLFGKDVDVAERGILGEAKFESKSQEHAINVPVYLNYGFQLVDDFKFFLFAGPTVQYGLSSKTTYTGDYTGAIQVGTENTVDNYGTDSTYKRLNVFVGGGLGMNAGPIQVTVGYDYGLMNLSTAETVKMNRSNLKIGGAFLF